MTTEKTETEFDIDAKMAEWHEATNQLAHWKEQENALRLEIFNWAFPTPVKGKGNKTKITHGMALIGDYRLNYKIDRSELDMALKDEAIEPIIREIVTFDPKVSGSKFEGLSDNEKKTVAPLITVTPGTPGLELKPANKVRW